jgi:hypothetical protein
MVDRLPHVPPAIVAAACSTVVPIVRAKWYSVHCRLI